MINALARHSRRLLWVGAALALGMLWAAGGAYGSDQPVPLDSGLQLRDVLTITGAVAAAAIITGTIQVLKSVIKVIAVNHWEQALALGLSALLVILAFADQATFTLPAGFEAFLAWLAIAKGATSIYDELAQKPGAFTSPDVP